MLGNGELDTVVSSRGKSKGCIATFVERQTRFYVAIKIENRSATEMYRAISELYELFPKDTFKTYTVDRGKEFACYSKIEADLKVPVYFADAYSSWQRGSNKNANGLLREFFPKKTDLARVTEEEVNEALYLINQRPRKCLGWKTSWELDTVVSSRGKSKGCIATFVERQTRFYVAIKIENRSATEMYRAISELYELFPKDTFKTYTVDRGKEFACYSKIEADLKVPVYFADAYSSWQRGSNKNANGLLREFFPKKTDLARVTEEEVNEALYLINQRPRKCLGWKTSFELFHEKLSHLY